MHGVDHQFYWIAVYFCSTNYRTDPKLCGILNRCFKYCGMYMKLCQVSLVSLVVAIYVLSFPVAELLRYWHLCLPVL